VRGMEPEHTHTYPSLPPSLPFSLPPSLPPSLQATEKSKDVTCVEWSRDGERVLTGCYDGVARWGEREGREGGRGRL